MTNKKQKTVNVNSNNEFLRINEDFNLDVDFSLTINTDEKEITSNNVTKEMQNELDTFYDKLRMLEKLENEVKIFKEKVLLPFLTENDKNTLLLKDIKLKKVDESEVFRLDTKRLQETNKAIYDAYLIKSKRKAYISKSENTPSKSIE